MAVYVDDYRGRLGRMVMCHMMADTIGELHEFARRLGLRRSWFQNKACPHYDVCLSKRKETLELGAIHLPIADRQRWREVYRRAKLRRANDD